MRKNRRAGLSSLTLLDIAVAVAATSTSVTAASAQGAPSWNWSGFYVGGHAGYRQASAIFNSDPYRIDPNGPGGHISNTNFPPRSEGYSLNGAIFGAQAGYNVQFNPNWLFGIEGDWSGGHADDSTAVSSRVVDSNGDGFAFRRSSKVKLSWEATLRGRFGYVAGPWLLYTTAGGAWTKVTWTDDETISEITSGLVRATRSWNASKTLTGWVIGGGVEYLYGPNWIVRVEYLLESFGDFTVPQGFGPSPAGSQFGKLDLDNVQKVRLAISYKFGP